VFPATHVESWLLDLHLSVLGIVDDFETPSADSLSCSLWLGVMLTDVVSSTASKFDSDEALARALQQEEAGGRTTRASRAARRGGLDAGIATRSR